MQRTLKRRSRAACPPAVEGDRKLLPRCGRSEHYLLLLEIHFAEVKCLAAQKETKIFLTKGSNVGTFKLCERQKDSAKVVADRRRRDAVARMQETSWAIDQASIWTSTAFF
jgi:hypothetical protein